MDIYDSRFFVINKTMQRNFGLWPYPDGKKKFIVRTATLIAFFCMVAPQILRVYMHYEDVDIIIEHVATIMFVIGIYTKVFTFIFAETKLQILYDKIRENWAGMEDERERNILIEYSERGRLLTIGYMVYVLFAVVSYCGLPMKFVILDKIMPLNETRPRVFIWGGEFFVDRDAHYFHIYVYDFCCAVFVSCLTCSFDPMYAATIEHCLGLFAIVQFRLHQATKFINDASNTRSIRQEITTYKYIVKTIDLHKKALIFTNILESSYSTSFLLILALNMIMMSLESVLVLMNLSNFEEVVRFSSVLVGLLCHLFYISWPGQKLINISTSLYQDIYLNEWYKIPIKAQKLLGFMMLRCRTPSQLTAGGLYVMNFPNFVSIVKTSASYITIFSSFR